MHNLKLFREAVRICEETETSAAFQRSARFWKPHLHRDLINAIKETPRFSITRVENLAEDALAVCETRADAHGLLMSLLIATSLARAYIAHGNFKDAFRTLSPWLDRIDAIPQVGPLHQAGYFRAWAMLYSTRGDYGADWKYFARRAARIAVQAGLEHQLEEIRRDAGRHAQDLAPDAPSFIDATFLLCYNPTQKRICDLQKFSSWTTNRISSN